MRIITSTFSFSVGISDRKTLLSGKTFTAILGRCISSRSLMMKDISQGLYH